MPEVKPDVTDAAELAEILQFLSEWLARDPGRPGVSLAEFTGQPAYGLAHLPDDLERVVSCFAAATASSSSAPNLDLPAPSQQAHRRPSATPQRWPR
jgi:hypothetical protein